MARPVSAWFLAVVVQAIRGKRARGITGLESGVSRDSGRGQWKAIVKETQDLGVGSGRGGGRARCRGADS